MNIFKKIVKIFFLIVILVTLVYLYSKYLNANGFIVKEKTLYSKQLPQEFDGLKIVQISDINYGTSIKKEELRKIIKKINLTKPDIVFLTGDLLNSKYSYNEKDINYITKQLDNIDTTIDKYAIKGDQDNESWNEIITNSGFVDLNNSYKIIYKNNSTILISGLNSSNNKKITKLIKPTIEYSNNNNLYSILVMHEPDTIKKIDYDKFNLILAGHSLGGQFKIPLIGGLITKKGAHKYINSHYKLNNTDIYVSNGLGNEDIKYRFLNKPSFNLFRIRTKTN